MIPRLQGTFCCSRRGAWAAFLAVFLIVCLFGWFSRLACEDYFIAFRTSKNFSLGHGMVYTPGARVYAYTSAFGTLLPGICSAVSGNRSDELALWLFRLAGAALLGLTAVLLCGIAQRLELVKPAGWFLLAAFASNTGMIMFTAGGMETGLTLFGTALTIAALMLPLPRRECWLGGALGCLLLARPDGFVFFAALTAGWLIFRDERSSRRADARLLAKALGIGALIYLPWLVWAWWYYGTPVPHTLIAKSLGKTAHLGHTVVHNFYTDTFVGGLRSLPGTFMPPYYAFGGWHQMEMLMTPVALAASFAWLFPFIRPRTRALSCAAWAGHFYLTNVVQDVMPWYLAPVTLISLIVLAQLLHQAWSALHAVRSGTFQPATVSALRRWLLAGYAGFLGVSVLFLAGAAYQWRVHQLLVEDGLRKPAALWLKQHAATPRETVLTECPGYLGYYSGLEMYDFNGLASPAEVAVRRRYLPQPFDYTDLTYFGKVILDLRPDWLVMRPAEVKFFFGAYPALREMYDQVVRFDCSRELQQVGFLPGKGIVEFNQTFAVYKRQH